jgi:peroxidase
VCGLRKARNFQDLESVMDPNVARAMSRIYRNVDDIDLFIGGVSENNIKGALVGPTFACLIAEQFRRIKNGDRFWYFLILFVSCNSVILFDTRYENGGLDSSFTEEQLRELRKVSLARIICDNSDDIQSIQPFSMVQPSNW